MSSRNYGAITCETCKAFYRRLTLKVNNYLKCVANGDCIITPETRKYCPKCRLDKCLAVGMKSQFIRSDEENEWRRRMGEEKRRQKLLKTSKPSAQETRTTTTTIAISSHNCNEIDALIDSTTDISDNDLNQQIMDIENSCQSNQELNVRQWPAIPVFKSLVNYNGINQLELQRISGLLWAAKVFAYPSNKVIIDITNEREMYLVSMKRIDCHIREVTKFVKQLDSLCSEDQLSLLRSGCFEVIMFRFAMHFNPHTPEMVCRIDNEYSVRMCNKIPEFAKWSGYERYKPFLDKVMPEWNLDPIIMLMLTVIILYNPHRPTLLHRENVNH
ncbi:unnamed protein product [Medioppia subpectinata]|uniref:Nuclear receptor domain-containing protein n=1 Tax=Medioppia subpectinata TaxID=1979941 RepID=A0A7R9PXI6_9ACAR|nr:unnamed protein product [Medioppia subpectinata]CAG2104053.1 unnamed protein product [Medioppia subpectinata]